MSTMNMEINNAFCEWFIEQHNLPYKAIRLLGKGKSGYSFLCETVGDLHTKNLVTLKIMHNEECHYYTFSNNKVELEVAAFQKLKAMGVHIPELLSYSIHANYLVKEYIEGEPCNILIARGDVKLETLKKVYQLSKLLKYNGYNIDYFPTNFVIGREGVVYVDYEINPFDEKWSFENWGIFYWFNSKGFIKYNETNDSKYINCDEFGTPVKTDLEEIVTEFLNG